MRNFAFEALPRRIRTDLDELVAALRSIHDKELVGIVVHGSAARGDFKEGESNLDVIVVLSSAPRKKLETSANALAIARAAARIKVTFLLEDEIQRAADVFPLFYDDIRVCHASVFGRNPFESIVISDEHRRLRIEQELREALFQLRKSVTEARGDDRLLASEVTRVIRRVRFPLHALLGLLGVEANHKLDIVLTKACKHFIVDSAKLFRVGEHPTESFDRLTTLLERAIEGVDRLVVRAVPAVTAATLGDAS